MKRISWMLFATGLTFSLALSSTACSDPDDNEDTDDDVGDGDGDATEGSEDCVDPSDPDARSEAVTGDITEDTTWTCNTIYRLAPDTHVFVKGATLTIEPGTTIQGLSGSALVIDKDASIEAVGTADAPIVMTSSDASPAAGDWGGLVLLGSAPNNLDGGIGQAEGFASAPTYGGSDAAHDCGTLSYVRVEYAGFAISEGNELNAITFYSCGTGTTVDHVQTHMGLDDGFEMFGGGFDAHHLIATGASDDSIDIDEGYQGTLQYLFIHQSPGVGDNGFEIANQPDNFDAAPRATPIVCNATFVGSGASGEKSKGATLKEGTNAEFYASIMVNATNEALLLADDAAWEQLDAGEIVVKNNIFFGNLGATEFNSGATMLDSAGFDTWVRDAANANLDTDPGIDSSWQAPSIIPSGDVSGDGTVGAGCEATSYIGAVDPSGDDWTQAGWANFSE